MRVGIAPGSPSIHSVAPPRCRTARVTEPEETTAISAREPPAAATKASNTRRRRNLASAPPIANNVPDIVLRVDPAGNRLIKRPTHHLTIRIDPSPELNIDCRLVEQHSPTVERRRARLARPLQERSVGRIRDHIGHDQVHWNGVECERYLC